MHTEITNELLEDDEDNDKGKVKTNKRTEHVFQALQYLRKLCNHPVLVLNENHPEYKKILEETRKQKKDLTDISYSPKMQALRQLLMECGIGIDNGNNGDDLTELSTAESSNSQGALSKGSSSAGHRVLIFAQLKSVLDIIEHNLFKKYMPSVTYLRMDGSVESSRRQDLVNTFNSDPTIDVLLLTTKVGGLGLNLTGADTVIFVEHDWNPQAGS